MPSVVGQITKGASFTVLIDADSVGGDGGSNVLPDNTVAETNVTQHEAALNVGNMTGTLAVANGGTGQTAQQAAIDALTNVSAATDEHVLTKDTATGNAIFKAAAGGGSGDVTGPASSTDNAVARFNGTTGKTIQNSAVVIADTDDVSGIDKLAIGETFSFESEVAASSAIDWRSGNMQKITLTANTTFTFTDPAGPCRLRLKVTQDATGGRTTTWPATVKWPGNVQQEVYGVASSVSIIDFDYDGTDYRASTLSYES